MISKKEIKDNELSFDDLVQLTMQATGKDEARAIFIVSMELGIIGPEGDVITDLDPDPEIQAEIEEALGE